MSNERLAIILAVALVYARMWLFALWWEFHKTSKEPLFDVQKQVLGDARWLAFLLENGLYYKDPYAGI